MLMQKIDTQFDGAQAQMIAIVAHELRHPLVPIRNAAALLKGAPPDPDAIRHAAEIIERESNRMNRLIGDLADVSRMQLLALEMCPARTLLASFLEDAIEAAREHAEERGLILTLSVSPLPVYLQVDELRLSQALHHLVTNACKFTDRHGHIQVRAHREGQKAVIVVSDSGAGIHPSKLETIFGLFARAGGSPSRDTGLGLGLYLARHFVEAHGGTLKATSAGANRGSEFTIKLPCESASTTDVPPAAA